MHAFVRCKENVTGGKASVGNGRDDSQRGCFVINNTANTDCHESWFWSSHIMMIHEHTTIIKIFIFPGARVLAVSDLVLGWWSNPWRETWDGGQAWLEGRGQGAGGQEDRHHGAAGHVAGEGCWEDLGPEKVTTVHQELYSRLIFSELAFEKVEEKSFSVQKQIVSIWAKNQYKSEEQRNISCY